MVAMDEADTDLGAISHLETVQALLLPRRYRGVVPAKLPPEIRGRRSVVRTYLKARRHWMAAARRRMDRAGKDKE
jgi:hypothetical protein